MANTNIMKATWEVFYDLQDKNLTMFAQYTAGPWEYIGTQGVIQGTFETLGAVGEQHFGGSLVGRIYFTAGLGGMGRNQPRAMTMHGGVCLVVDANQTIIQRALDRGFLDVQAATLEEAIAMAESAKAEGGPRHRRHGNAAEIFPEGAGTGLEARYRVRNVPLPRPALLYPRRLHPGRGGRTARREPRVVPGEGPRVDETPTGSDECLLRQGVQVFEYGTSIRKECRDAGMPEEEAMTIPGFVAAYIRPLFMLGRGPFRWTCLSGEASDLAKIDDLVLEMFPHDKTTVKVDPTGAPHLPIEALPARVCYLGFGERKALALRINQMIRDGELAGPVGFSRDNLDSGSIVNPTFESEKMKDGGDLISDWPYLNALLNTAAMADLVAIQANYSMGEAVHTGVTMIADGSEEADLRLEACMTTDSGIGVVRHAQAGYEPPARCARGRAR